MLKRNDVAQILLSAVYTIGYVLVLLSFVKDDVVIAESIKPQFDMVLGMLTTIQAQIFNFWFGSFRKSEE